MDAHEKLFYAVLAMNCLFAAAVYCALSPSRLSVALLLISSAVWPFVNFTLEGQLVIKFDKDHGLTVSDLLSVAGLTVAAVQYRKLRKPPRRRRRPVVQSPAHQVDPRFQSPHRAAPVEIRPVPMSGQEPPTMPLEIAKRRS